jgi:hypothetical protein
MTVRPRSRAPLFLMAVILALTAGAPGVVDGAPSQVPDPTPPEQDPPAERVRQIGRVVVLTPSDSAGAPAPIYSEERVREWLQPLVGEIFQEEKAVRRVARRYELLGYDARVEVRLGRGALDVTVLESPGVIGAVSVGPEPLRPHLPARLLEGMDPINRPHVLSRAVRLRAGQLVNRERVARDGYDLALLGYDVVPVPSGAGDEAASRRYVIARRPRLRDWRADAGDAPPLIDPLQKRWISSEAEYTRRSLFVARLYYTRAHLFREFDRVEISPYVAQQLAGAVRYTQPYILPASVTPWNVFGEVRLYDEFVPDRLLEGIETDERRVGGLVAFGLEPFRHLKGHSLKGRAFLNRYHVTFGEFQIPINGGIVPRSAGVPGGELNDVNLVGVEMDYTYRHLYRAPRFWWQFLPKAELATKAFGGDIDFRRISGELRHHYAWSTGFELDTSWKAGVVDRDVPLFEQFALGGADSLRGFLRDDFLGRRFWSAQNDLWVPIPFRAFGRESKVLAALQRNLKTALTLDGGSISFEETVDTRFARGIGLGLRYSAEASPLVVRIDAAWGFWRGERRFYPYLSFTRKW